MNPEQPPEVLSCCRTESEYTRWTIELTHWVSSFADVNSDVSSGLAVGSGSVFWIGSLNPTRFNSLFNPSTGFEGQPLHSHTRYLPSLSRSLLGLGSSESGTLLDAAMATTKRRWSWFEGSDANKVEIEWGKVIWGWWSTKNSDEPMGASAKPWWR